MTLQLIGAGFGRTGTMSVKRALEQLGLPCYHMHEVFPRPAHVEQWRRAGRGEAVDWDALFAEFRATMDWPAARFWRELAAAYPRAPVLLTVRDPDVWYQSACNTVFQMQPSRATTSIGREQLLMAQEVVFDATFGAGRLGDRAHCIDVYLRHNAEVQRALGDRVLSYDPAEGWGPLCALLGVAVPDVPFPHNNSTADFRRRAGLDAG